MPQIDRVNVATLTRLADIAGTHDRLVATAEGGIQTSGRVSAFFTAKATHRATAEAFLGAIRNKYGDGIADALAPQLSAMRQQGKPLKARVARDILAQASNMSQALGPANTEMARRFLLGNNGAGDTRNLDHALQDFYAKNNLQPSPALRQAFERIINDMAANSQKQLSYQDMADAVTMQTLQSRPATPPWMPAPPILVWTASSRPSWASSWTACWWKKARRGVRARLRTSSAIFPRPTRPPCNALPLPAASRA